MDDTTHEGAEPVDAVGTPSPPYVGIATFLKLPLVTALQAGEWDFVVLGIPYDEGASNRPGTRFGPRALRNASTLYSYEGGAELFDVELGRTILRGARVGDRGDVIVWPLASAANRRNMVAAAAEIVRAGAIPVTLGGDHSVTASVLEGFREARPDAPLPYLLHLDAHMDFDSYLVRYAHGTPVRVAVEDSLVTGVTQVGIRGLNSGEADWAEAQERGVRIVTAGDFIGDGVLRGVERVLALVPPGVPLYLSMDIDAFDPGIAPGTGTPEPGGLSYRDGRALVAALAAHARVVGLDLVEVNPAYDHGEITAVLGARVLIDAMGAIWDARLDGDV
jgi:agmatinase